MLSNNSISLPQSLYIPFFAPGRGYCGTSFYVNGFEYLSEWGLLKKKIARREYSMRVRGSTATAGFAGKKLMCLKAGCAFTAHTACDPISG